MLDYIWTNRWITISFIFLFVLAALFCVWTLHDLGSFNKRMSINVDVMTGYMSVCLQVLKVPSLEEKVGVCKVLVIDRKNVL